MSARVGVVLSGCGVYDGSEIQEASSALIALDRRGATVTCMAPGGDQSDVVDHLTQKVEKAKRDILRESARIARGKIKEIAEVSAEDLDVLIFPGGFGAAKNLSNYASAGKDCKVHPGVQKLIEDFHAAHKPIGLACIAPVLAARVLGAKGVKPKLTIGHDPDTAAAIEAMGGSHQETPPSGIAVDAENRLVSTPAYMNDVGPWAVYLGIERMVEELLNMAGDPDASIRQQMAAGRK